MSRPAPPAAISAVILRRCALLLWSLTAALAAEPDATPLELRTWSGSLNVPDPVALSVDFQGRVYVTETRRRKIQDLDIRNHRDWIPHDVGLRSPADKLAFYRDRLAPEHSDANRKRVADLNGDGSHDYRDLGVLSERLHRLADTDGDGTADQSTVFADDFRTEITGIAAGILWHDGSVFATIAPDVWKLRDDDDDGVAEHREVVAHGFGHHIAYAGHDMHGLTVGPDGKIYWTVGDKGIAVRTPEGREFHYPNEGGVLRCNPDGTEFEVYARGLRNVQELAFDEFGNLFGVDNDADFPGEEERFVHLVEGMDAGWRCSYQYRGSGYNPWTAEGLWKPAHPGQPAYLLPPVANTVDGPCGFAYHPGVALDETWARTFFLTEAPGGKQWAFRAEPDGPTFRMTPPRLIASGVAITGWKFGPDGALYGADWGVTGYNMDERGAVRVLDVAPEKRSPLREATRRLLAAGTASVSVSAAELETRLGHPDQRVRLAAQFELARRGDAAPLVRALASAERLARVHAVWGLGQLRTPAPLLPLLADADPELRAQAAKTLGQLPRHVPFPPAALVPRLADPDPAVRFHAAQALGNRGVPDPALREAVLAFVDADPDHPWFRHAQARALAATARPEDLAALRDSPSPERRMRAVLALRQTASPLLAAFLDDPSPAVRDEAARAIHDGDSVPDALPALAEALDHSPGNPSEAFLRRAVNANFRIGTPEAALRVLGLALRPEVPVSFRAEALDALLAWVSPPPLDRVDGWRRDLPSRDPGALADTLRDGVNALAATDEAVLLEKTVALASALDLAVEPARLLDWLKTERVPVPLRLVALDNLGSPEAIALALRSRDASLRIRAAELLAAGEPASARSHLTRTLDRSGSLPERQAAVRLLADLEADDVLRPWWDRLASGEAPPGIRLDLLEAAAARDVSVSFPRDAADPLAEWSECLEGGSATAGAEVFRHHLGAQCLACHKMDRSKGGSLIGPNLQSVGLRDGRYLLESLVNPQATVAPGYGVVAVALTDGASLTGILQETTDLHVVVRDPVSGKPTSIPRDRIASLGPPVSLMPPMGFLLSKRELRDLVAYLATLRAP
jgi:putative membrane-bound dehydrogenase-like protein